MIGARKELDDRASAGFCQEGFRISWRVRYTCIW